MKLYAVRDRLINYFMTPFAAPEDHNAMASIATVINNIEENSVISQCPQHYEIWRLASVDDQTGKITGEPELLAGCEALVRPRRPTAEPGARQSEGSPGGRRAPPGGDGTNTALTPGALQEAPDGADGRN